MEARKISVGDLQTNCYLIWNESNDCYIIDPGDDADFISTEIIRLKLNPLAILLTHGHYDHCLACLELKLNFNIPIYLNAKDSFLYKNAVRSSDYWSATKALKQPPTSPFPKKITLGKETIQVILTPGHTPGSVCFYNAPHLIVGDTIFEDGIGRTDFSYSSPKDLNKSLAKILSYPKETLIYPGHGNSPVEIYLLKNRSS